MRKPIVVALVAMACLQTACVREAEKKEVVTAPAKIDRLVPDKVMAGEPFNVQPGGLSAMSVIGSNLIKGARIRFDGQPLETAAGDGTTLAALVPAAMIEKDGAHQITVDLPDGRVSNALTFTVLPKSGPAPEITQLFPDTAVAGKGINVQPNGVSAMGLKGKNFLPGAKILINNQPLETNFGDVDTLGAVVPDKLIARPGKLSVTVKNPDGKASAPATLTLTN
jgi:hypothetical protein